jgi:hypothetical protein
MAGIASLCIVLPPAAHARAPEDAGEIESRTLVAQARTASRLGPLKLDPRLADVAREHTDRMIRSGGIAHNSRLGGSVSDAGVDWRWVGENVGVGPNVRSIHDGFMASPKHHEIIVYPEANAIGIGVAKGDDGRTYVTQVFARIVDTVAAPAVARPEPKDAVGQRAIAPTRAKVTPADPNAVIGGIVKRLALEPTGRPRHGLTSFPTRSG